MKYITLAKTQVWSKVWPLLAGKRTLLAKETIVTSTWDSRGYAYLDCFVAGKLIRGWADLNLLQPYSDPVIPPPPQPVGDIWWTSYWPLGVKPIGLNPEGVNLGSFALGWVLPEELEGVVNKPFGFNLSRKHIEGIRAFNPQNPGALNWLVDETGTKDVLSLTAEGVYRCPVPCFSEFNPVRVLELTDRFARIETVSIYDPLPETLPPHLLHTWYGYTKGGVFWKVQDASGGVYYPLFARSNSAWVQRLAIQPIQPRLS